MEMNNLSNARIIDIFSSTSIEEFKHISLKIEREERLGPASQCCIYSVPIDLRTTSPKAYTPQFISIGPLHHGKEELSYMEKQKIRYKRDFVERIGEQWTVLIGHIQTNEQRIRDCYAETSKLESNEFIVMIFLDAIFIIELFLKYQELRLENEEELQENEEKIDFLLANECFSRGIWLDLQLIENQLPFFILKDLYELASPSLSRKLTTSLPTADPFLKLSCNFFGENWYEEVNGGEFLHFVDLRRKFLVWPFLLSRLLRFPASESRHRINYFKNKDDRRWLNHDLPSAIKLHESGIKFTYKGDHHLLNVQFDDKVHKLRIPHITIEDSTEDLFRNMMALEQCHYPSETHICNYIDLMDYLIDTEKDVELLVDKGIIANYVGEHAAIAKMFNRLCLQITVSDSYYKEISEDLKDRHRNWWHRTMATLKRVYFSNLWRGTGTIAAFMLLALTLLQTVFTIRG